MSSLTNYDFMGGFNTPLVINKIIGKLEQDNSSQIAAATSADDLLLHAKFPGQITDLYVVVAELPGAGENIVYDVKKNGSTILSSTFTLNAATATEKVVNLYDRIDADKRSFVAGDVFTVDRTYTAGTPTPIGNNTVVIEPSLGPIRIL
jgi:hypothetical protein